MSGYVNCACRDCFEIAISGDDDENGTFCSDCEEAGCEKSLGARIRDVAAKYDYAAMVSGR